MRPKAKSKSRSASPVKQARQPTLDDLFTQQERKSAETPKPAPKPVAVAKKRRRVAASDDEKTPPSKVKDIESDDDVPLVRLRRSTARVQDSDDEPLSSRRKGKARAIIPASDDEPHHSSHDTPDAIDLMSSDPIEPIDLDEVPTSGPSDPPLLDDYDDDAFPWDAIPDEGDYFAPVPDEPDLQPRKRPRQSIFDLPDFANEPASQVPRSRSSSPLPVAEVSSKKGKGKLPAVKFADFSLLNELDEKIRTFYEQHWRRGAGEEDDEWHEADRLAFTAAPPKRKAAPRRGGWFRRARGRGRGRGRG